MSSEPMRILDVQSHWGTERGYLFRTPEALARQEAIWRTKVEYFTEDGMCDEFVRHGTRAILDLSYPKFWPIERMREEHDYAFALARRRPDAIAGHWLQFDPRRAYESIKEFERALGAGAGFVGLCVNGQVTGVAPSDPRWDVFYQASQAAGTPVMILTGLTGIGQGLPGGDGIELDHGHPRHIDNVASRYPDLRILAARPAWPWQDEMLAVLLHKPNVAYELHGWGPRRYSPELRKAIATWLQDRVMFGCDFPVLRHAKLRADWQSLGLEEEILAKVLHRNAEAYFGLKETPR